MNTRARNLLILMLVGGVFVVLGCEKDEDTGWPTRPPAVNWRNLHVTLQDMDSHLGDMIAFRVVSRVDPAGVVDVFDELRAVARLDSLEQANFEFVMPLAVPEGLHRLDFWCDSNGDGWYTGPLQDPLPQDHAYRIYLPETGEAAVTFYCPPDAADTLGAYFYSEPDSAWFLDINQPTWLRPPAHFWMNFTGMDTCMGHLLELQVVEPTSGITRGYYRDAVVTQADFQVVLPSIGALDENDDPVVFQIDFYVDMNDNGTYDAPPADFAWTELCTTGFYLEPIGPGHDTTGGYRYEAYADSLIKDFTFNTNYTTIIWP